MKSTSIFINHPSKMQVAMSSSSVTEGPHHIAIARVDQEVMSYMILVDFTALNQQDSQTGANEMKD
jgi:hypothetical protein